MSYAEPFLYGYMAVPNTFLYPVTDIFDFSSNFLCLSCLAEYINKFAHIQVIVLDMFQKNEVEYFYYKDIVIIILD